MYINIDTFLSRFIYTRLYIVKQLTLKNTPNKTFYLLKAILGLFNIIMS